MTEIIILNKNPEIAGRISKKIKTVISDTKMTITKDIEESIKMLNTTKPQIVFIDFDVKDKNGKNLLERLTGWDFEAVVCDNDDYFQVLDDKKGNKQGYLLKKINDFKNLFTGGL